MQHEWDPLWNIKHRKSQPWLLYQTWDAHRQVGRHIEDSKNIKAKCILVHIWSSIQEVSEGTEGQR